MTATSKGNKMNSGFKRITKLAIFSLSFLAFAGPFNVANAEKGFLEKGEGYNPVDPSLVEDLLSYLETTTKGNYDQIASWQGLIDFVSIRLYAGNDVNQVLEKNKINIEVIPKKCEELAEGTIYFKADLKRDMRWVHLCRPKSPIFKDAETMKILGSSGFAFDATIIKTPDFITKATPHQFAQDGSIFKRSATKVGKNSLDYRRMLGFAKYPTNCFDAIGPTWNWLLSLRMLLFNETTTPKIFKDAVVIEKRSIGNETEFYIRFGVLDNTNNYIESFYEMVLPSNVGYNPNVIRILETPDNKLNREFNISYLDLNDVFLPLNYHEIHYNADGMVTVHKQYTLKEQKINKTIEEEVFGIASLGLKDSDKFEDKILGKEYTYQEGKLIEVEK